MRGCSRNETLFPRLRFGLVAGFTLIEVVVALALSVVLLAAVYGSFLFYTRISVSAQRPIDQGQISRALFRQLSVDIRSVVFRPPDSTTRAGVAAAEEGTTSSGTTDQSATGTGVTTGAASGTTPGNGTGTSGTSGTAGTAGTSGTSGTADTAQVTGSTQDGATTVAAAPTLTAGAPNLGLVGDATNLVLHVSRPERGLNYGSAAMAVSVSNRTSDLMSISYFVATRDGGGLAGMVGQQATPLSAIRDPDQNDGHAVGLARLEGDRMAIDYADVQADEQTLAEASRVIAREIVSLQFRYFDGSGWVASWDTGVEGRLPYAVEVTIGFRPPRPRPKPGERATIGVTLPVTEFVTQIIEVPAAGSYASLQAP
jgi:prepilin-type N-terminal cleavage/methylation domain-containing protein